MSSVESGITTCDRMRHNLQCAIGVTKCDKILLKVMTGIKKATIVTKCNKSGPVQLELRLPLKWKSMEVIFKNKTTKMKL